MINKLIEAISMTLNSEFGDMYDIHMDEIKQDLKKPCFFISCLNSSTKLVHGRRFFKENQFVIQYFPESNTKLHECNEVAEKLVWCLEYITMNGDLLHGAKMKYEVFDGVLRFLVNYDYFIYKVVEEEPAAEKAEFNINVRSDSFGTKT